MKKPVKKHSENSKADFDSNLDLIDQINLEKGFIKAMIDSLNCIGIAAGEIQPKPVTIFIVCGEAERRLQNLERLVQIQHSKLRLGNGCYAVMRS